ncbi:hypothetical protein NE237_003795 [Protea cynaroides]|uniref:Cobalamin-independent methionine synthase MetE C-terminal/archaeal domain-containing protein n=1 Tax=Protea cynaroides TaxID=273540 RepID=A0A9Q0KI22_9MAGN|nr:hypothetical protein NE237_003795 [Protea cynaroides]
MTVFWSSMAQRMSKHPMKDSRPTTYQIALAIKDEVEDLEKAGSSLLQNHQLHHTDPHTHVLLQLQRHHPPHHRHDMDADVITIENSRSDEKLLSVFREGVKYGADIGPGVYEIHSPRIPSVEEIADRVNKMLAVLETHILWINPDCVLKTRKYGEVKPARSNMVAATKLLLT